VQLPEEAIQQLRRIIAMLRGEEDERRVNCAGQRGSCFGDHFFNRNFR